MIALAVAGEEADLVNGKEGRLLVGGGLVHPGEAQVLHIAVALDLRLVLIRALLEPQRKAAGQLPTFHQLQDLFDKQEHEGDRKQVSYDTPRKRGPHRDIKESRRCRQQASPQFQDRKEGNDEADDFIAGVTSELRTQLYEYRKKPAGKAYTKQEIKKLSQF